MRIACVPPMNSGYINDHAEVILPFGNHHFVGHFGDFFDDVEKNGKPDLIILDFGWLSRCLPYNSLEQKSMHSLSDVPHIILHALATNNTSSRDDKEPFSGYKEQGHDKNLNVIAVMSTYDAMSDKYTEIVRDFIDFHKSVSGNPLFRIDADNFKIYREQLKRDLSIATRPVDSHRLRA